MTPKKTSKASDPSTTIDEDTNFEAALKELEALVDQMESGDLSLDESLSAFERGIRLARHCQGELRTAEQRIQVLTDEGRLESLDDFTDDDSI